MEEGKKNKIEKERLQTALAYFQIAFFVVIGFFTWDNSNQTSKMNKLIYQPVIGITDMSHYGIYDGKAVWENLKKINIIFNFENVGNLPAKNFKKEVACKIGHTLLPSDEPPQVGEGYRIIQRQKVNYQAIIHRDIIEKIDNKEMLVFTFDISYYDEKDQKYTYRIRYQAYIISKEPLALGYRLLP